MKTPDAPPPQQFQADLHGCEKRRSAWNQIIDAAARYNPPGVFTALTPTSRGRACAAASSPRGPPRTRARGSARPSGARRSTRRPPRAHHDGARADHDRGRGSQHRLADRDGGVLSFGAGILVSEIFEDDDDGGDYWNSRSYGNMWYGPMPYYPPSPYRPRYGSGFYPSQGCNRPNNYARGNNVIVVNQSNNYWNRYDNDRSTAARSKVDTGRPAASVKSAAAMPDVASKAPNVDRGRAADPASSRLAVQAARPEAAKRTAVSGAKQGTTDKAASERGRASAPKGVPPKAKERARDADGKRRE